MIIDNKILFKALLCVCMVFGPLCMNAQQCREYDGQLGNLTPNQRTLLSRHKVVQEKGSLLISPKMVSDCTLRAGVARFIWDGIHENLTNADSEFARHHHALVNSTIKVIWPLIAESLAIPSDGNLYSEKWNLLRNEAVDDETVAALVSSNIARRGLWSDAGYLLIHRSLPQLASQIQAISRSKSSVITEKLYALAVLSRISNVDPLRLLEKATHEVRLTDIEQKAVASLRTRFTAHQPAKWADIEKLTVED